MSLAEVVSEEISQAEVAAWARRTGGEPREVRLQPLRRKRAGCSSRGRLTFNTELPRQPAAFRAEVIVHE